MSSQLKARNYIINILYRHQGELIKIPSYNDLGPKLGIAKSSVQLALKQLIADGFLISKVGVGTFSNPSRRLNSAPGGKSLVVGLINGDGKDFYYSYYTALMNGALFKALAHRCIDIQPIMIGLYNAESIKEELLTRKLDAILWCNPPRLRVAMLQELAIQVPLLVVDAIMKNLHCIVFDSRENGHIIAQRLLDDGRKKLAVSPCVVRNEPKCQNLLETFARNGRPVEPDFIFDDDQNFINRLEDLLQQNRIPDALVFNPEETEAIRRTLEKYGIRLPEQCQPVCSMFRPQESKMPMYVQQIDFDDFAEKAVSLLLGIRAQRDLIPEVLTVNNSLMLKLV